MTKTRIFTLSAIFILVGLLGFTSNSLVGTDALFVTNTATNWFHLIAGVAIFVAGMY